MAGGGFTAPTGLGKLTTTGKDWEHCLTLRWKLWERAVGEERDPFSCVGGGGGVGAHRGGVGVSRGGLMGEHHRLKVRDSVERDIRSVKGRQAGALTEGEGVGVYEGEVEAEEEREVEEEGKEGRGEGELNTTLVDSFDGKGKLIRVGIVREDVSDTPNCPN